MIELIANGYSNKEIAELFPESEGTVRNYLSMILKTAAGVTAHRWQFFITSINRSDRR